MNDELVKRLREHNGWALNETLDEGADAIEELSRKYTEERNAAVELTGELASKPRWIPVKESLPEGEVIAVNALKGSYGYREYIIGYVDEDYESDSGYSCESEGEILVNVTHWMPLPEPPREETE